MGCLLAVTLSSTKRHHQSFILSSEPMSSGPLGQLQAVECVWPVGCPPAQDAATVPFAVPQPPLVTQGCSLCLQVPPPAPHARSNPSSSVLLCIHSDGELPPFHGTPQILSWLDGELHLALPGVWDTARQ